MDNQKLNRTYSVTPSEIKRLGSYLVEAGLLTRVEVDVALADQEATRVRFGDIIVIRGWLKVQTIEYFMRKLVLPEREAAERKAAAQQERLAQPTSTVKSRSSPVAKQKPLFGTFRDNDGWLG